MRTFCAVFVSAMLGSAGCAPMGGDDAPPVRDGGHEPGTDGPPPDGPAPDGLGGCTGEPIGCAPPRLIATSPADGATGVAPMLVITVRFNEPITASEPASGLLLLDEAGQPVPGTVEIADDLLRFVPADDLALLGAYTAVVTTAVTDLAGNPLASEHRFGLSVRDGAWETAGTPIENGTGSPSLPDVAMDSRGNAVAVWRQYVPASESIWASRYDARTGLWDTPQVIGHDDVWDARLPRVAMDDAGNAVAVWLQSTGAYDNVWASRYDAGAGWNAPVQLDVSNTGDAYPPRIAMNADGAAVVVWRQVEPTLRQAWFSRYVVGAGWDAAEPVQVSGAPISILNEDPVVAIDGQGTALVIVHDSRFQLLAVPHRAADGWGEAESMFQGSVGGVDLAMAPTGHALASWQTQGGSRIQAWHRDPGGASHLDVIMQAPDHEQGTLRAGMVAVDREGNGVAGWHQIIPDASIAWTSVYWAAFQQWEATYGWGWDDATQPRSAQVAMDPRGHAHGLWLIEGAAGDLAMMLRRRVAPYGFGGPSVYEEEVSQARLAMNAQGKAVIVRIVRSELGGVMHIDLDALFFR